MRLRGLGFAGEYAWIIRAANGLATGNGRRGAGGVLGPGISGGGSDGLVEADTLGSSMRGITRGKSRDSV